MRRKINDTIQVLQWEEDITLKNTENFRQEINAFLKLDEDKLILNLSSVRYINSAGLGIIAEGVIQARKEQKELVISNVQQSIEDIFSIVKFRSFINIFETEQQAIDFLTEKDNE